MEERNRIRVRLSQHKLSFTWLIYQLELRGLNTDKTEMSSVMAGTRKGAKVDTIIQTSHAILDDYDKGSVLVKGA